MFLPSFIGAWFCWGLGVGPYLGLCVATVAGLVFTSATIFGEVFPAPEFVRILFFFG